MPVVRSDFAGLWVSLRGLLAQQVAVDVTNHNIANANTEGFSRQLTVFEATRPFGLGPKQGQLGTGVDVGLIQRVRNVFLSRHLRSEISSLGEQNVLKDILQQSEVTWIELNAAGLGGTMTRFWNSWREVANAPDSVSARQDLVERSVDLANLFNQTYTRLNALRRDLDRQVASKVVQVNDLTRQIAALNRQIVQVRVTGAQPNDLQDRRDHLLDELSKIVNIAYVEAEDGSVGVTAGGSNLVSADEAGSLQTTVNATTGLADVIWPNGQPLSVTSGELAAILRLRDDTTTGTPISIPNQLNRLNSLASTVVSRVNAIHQQGMGLADPTGPQRDFFSPIPPGTDAAAAITVNPAIRSDPAKIAAASAFEPPTGTNRTPVTGPPPRQDGRIAAQVADLQRQALMAGNSMTIDDFYSATITQLGVEVQAAKRGNDTQEMLVNQVRSRIQEQSGVSIDEEATRLVSYQHAYQASARIMNVIDGMLQTLLGVGLVGR